jgi:hypothetical protein
VDRTRSTLPCRSCGRSPVPSGSGPCGRSGGASITRASNESGRRLPTNTPRSVGGAAGSRTRVPRSRSCGLYVRRSGIISDAVLPDQAASAIHTVSGVPAALDGPSQRVEPGDVDPLPLPGVGGGSSQVFRLRGPAHRWHVEVPDVGLTRSRQAPSARSHDDGMTTVETVSAPCRGHIDALRFSRMLRCPIPTRCWLRRAGHRTSSCQEGAPRG